MPGHGKKNWLIAAAVLAALVAAGAARLHTLVSIAGDRRYVAQRPDSLASRIAALREKISSVALTGGDARLAERLLPRDADAGAVVRAIRGVAVATGAELGELTVRDGEGSSAGWHPLDGGPVLALAVEADLTGSYDELALFINALEGGRSGYAGRLFEVGSLDFRAGRNGRHNAEILVRAFALPKAGGQEAAGGDAPETSDLTAVFAEQAFSFPAGGRDPMHEPERREPPPDLFGDRLASDLDGMRQAMAKGDFALAEQLASEALADIKTAGDDSVSERAESLGGEITQLRRLAFLERENAAKPPPDPVPPPDLFGDRLASNLDGMRQAMANGDFALVEQLASEALADIKTAGDDSVSERAESLGGEIAQLRRLAFLERENVAKPPPDPVPPPDLFGDRLASNLDGMRQAMANGDFALAEQLASEALADIETAGDDSVSERAESLGGEIAQLRRLAFLERENAAKPPPDPVPPTDLFGDRLASNLGEMRKAMTNGDFALVEQLASEALADIEAAGDDSVSERAESLGGEIAQLRRLAFLERENAAKPPPNPEPETPAIRVDGIAWSEDDPRVIVGGKGYGLGDALPAEPGCPAPKVMGILPHEAIFLFQGKRMARKVDLFGQKDFPHGRSTD